MNRAKKTPPGFVARCEITLKSEASAAAQKLQAVADASRLIQWSLAVSEGQLALQHVNLCCASCLFQQPARGRLVHFSTELGERLHLATVSEGCGI